MRIVYIAPRLMVAGGIRIIFEQASRLQKRGHQVTIITCGEETNVDWLRIKVPIRTLDQLEKYVWRADAVVATAWFTANIVNPILIDKAKKFYLVQGYEKTFFSDTDSWRQVEETYGYRMNYIAVSKWLSEVLSVYGQSSVHVPNGVDTNVFFPDSDTYPKEKEKVRVYIEGDPGQPWKGVTPILNALKGLPIETWTVFHGSKPVGSDRHFDRVSQPELRKIYSSCDITIKGSFMEGFGLGNAEAMACGSVVVTTDNGGCRDFCFDGENCLVAPSGDPWAVRESIEQLISDRELMDKLRRDGMETIREMMNWDDSIDRLEQVFSGTIRPAVDEHSQVGTTFSSARAVGAPFIIFPGPARLSSTEVSVIIPSFNLPSNALLFLEKFFQYTPSSRYELLIIESGLNPLIRDLLKTIPNINFIDTDGATDIGTACNRAVDSAHGRHIVFMKGDCVVSHNWLTNLLSAIEQDEDIHIISPTISRGEIKPDFDEIAYANSQREVEIALEGFDSGRTVFMAKKQLFKNISFSEGKFETYEENLKDFENKILNAGFGMGIINNVLVHKLP